MNKFIILKEVKDQSHYTTHSEIDRNNTSFSSWGTKTSKTLSEVVLNVDKVVSIREIHIPPEQLPEGLDERHRFSRITLLSGMNNRQIDVVGDISAIMKKVTEK
tara:strand:- start:201 stop:512 length:312 start_codon:yes stop_codon:yes gene_type:complete